MYDIFRQKWTRHRINGGLFGIFLWALPVCSGNSPGFFYLCRLLRPSSSDRDRFAIRLMVEYLGQYHGNCHLPWVIYLRFLYNYRSLSMVFTNKNGLAIALMRNYLGCFYPSLFTMIALYAENIQQKSCTEGIPNPSNPLRKGLLSFYSHIFMDDDQNETAFLIKS